MDIDISRVKEDPVEERKTELVERKGLGHPDSISDGIAEAVSRALCQEYMRKFGNILHHNTDEVQLIAGSSNPKLGGGNIEKKIYILIGGRATKTHQGEDIPVDNIALKAAESYIEQNFKALSLENIEFESKIGETSTDLHSIFSQEETPLSNDTSYGVGHAPLSQTEKTVKDVEKEIRDIEEVGEDVKVMALRQKNKLSLTVAAAIISGRVSGLKEYRNVLNKIEEKTREIGRKSTSLEINVDVNMADGDSEETIYLTVTGTSAEMGDDGSVGRGNRCNGLITPHRSMSLEAASGKNPVTHVGKIYNLKASKIAKQINGFAEVKMLSQIGNPIDSPQIIEIVTDSGENADTIQEKVQNSVSDLDEIAREVIEDKVDTF